MRSKKAVIVTNNYPPIVCGVGDYSSHLANQLYNEGYEVHVICRFDKSIETRNKFIKVWPIISRMSYSGFREAVRKINEISPDWLLIQYVPYAFHTKGMPMWLPNALRKIDRQRTKIAIRIHEPYIRFTWWPVTGFVYGQIQRLIIKQLSKVADRMITSIDLYKKFVDKYSIHPSVIVPIPSNIKPVDTTEEDIRAIRKRVAPNGEKIVSTFGIRNHRLLVEVFQKLLKKYPACKLLVCGAVKDEKLYESVRKHVFVTGYLPGEDVFRFLKCSDVFFLPDDVSKNG
jgi:glycosyltransferase involved in cell wall biosynthesis